MAICGENLVNDSGLTLYDSLIKNWVNLGLNKEKQARLELQDALNQEIVNRREAISGLSNELYVFSSYTITELIMLQDWLYELDSAVTQEIIDRESGDTEILIALSAETVARETDNTILRENLNAETSARESADTSILEEIHEYQNITNEQIDALFGGTTKIRIYEENEFEDYLNVTVIPKFANDGDIVTLIAELTGTTGLYEFDGWYEHEAPRMLIQNRARKERKTKEKQDAGTFISSSTTITIEFDRTKTYEPRLKRLGNYCVITIASNDESMGYVFMNEVGVTRITAETGTDITFVPYGVSTDDSLYMLFEWNASEMSSGEEYTIYNIQRDYNFVATFDRYHTLYFRPNDESLGNVFVKIKDFKDEYMEIYVREGGETIFTPYAIPNKIARFVEWSDGLIEEEENTVSNVTEDKTFIATFTGFSISNLVFTGRCGGSGVSDNGVVWAVNSDAQESNYDSERGIHYGTSSMSVGYVDIITTGISGNISRVEVYASRGSNNANISVSVGGVNFMCEGSEVVPLTTTNTSYLFEGNSSGEILVHLHKKSATKQAIYCKSISVLY